jgi:hypothetical protein
VVGLAAAGEHRVQLLTRLLPRRQPVHGVRGHALRAVDRRGVAELDPLVDVRGRQPHLSTRPQALHLETAVTRDADDLPAVAVLHPVQVPHGEPPVVAPRDHDVSGRASVPVR